MKHEHIKLRSAAPLRKRVDATSGSWVTMAPMFDKQSMPLMIRPLIDGVEIVAWAAQHRREISDLVFKHGAVLFRGFNIERQDIFHNFVEASSEGPALEYKDRSTPRETRGNRVYTSTVYPADQAIRPHNEGTYWLTWALKLFFCCRTAAISGGETPIADVRAVYQRLAPRLRDQFKARGVALVRNYNDGFGLPWQEVFQTHDRLEVEKYCRLNRIGFEWKGDERLRTRQIRPAIRKHPKTGELVWFNHAAFFHITSLDPEVQKALLTDCGEDDLPYNTYYGDGGAIEPDVIEQIHDAYRAETVMFPWCEGDVMILDNMSVAHARQPYQGERDVLVMMTEPYTGVETVDSMSL